MTHHRSTRVLVFLVATFAMAVGFLAAPANAAFTGKVSGVVTLDGKPLKGATVALMRTDADSGDAYTVYKRTTTTSAGSYTFSGYRSRGWLYNRVIVTDPLHRAVSTERSFTDSSTRAVTRNVTMQRAGSIIGKVTRADGGAPTTTRVHIEGPSVQFGPGGNERLVYDDDRGVSADGTYHFVGLPAGLYTIRYDDTARKYLSECYDDLLARQGENPYCDGERPKVTVTAGGVTKPIAQELDHVGARLLGIITDTSGNPLKSISVTPYRVGSTQSYGDNFFSTRTSGRFTDSPLESGGWQLRVNDLRGVWETRWYNSATRSGAKVFTLAEGTEVKGLAMSLKSRAKLRVKVAAGSRRATFYVDVTRRATGSRPNGKVTVSRGGVSKTVPVSKGVAKVTLTKLPAGKRTFHVDYRGTRSTADATTKVSTRIR